MPIRRVLQLSVLVAAATLSVAAQAKINYGSEYKCGNERVIVYYCRNDPGNDGGRPVHESENYCAVEYPDRPRANPQFPVPGSVLRSDLLKQFASCTVAPSSDPAVAKAQAAKVDTAVFGIQLGDPFSIPACPMFQIGGAGGKTCYSAISDDIESIARDLAGPNTIPANIKTVYLGAKECPSWVNECTLHVQSFGGRVGYVGVFTKGPGVDAEVRGVLDEKYGKWSLVRDGTVTPDDANKRIVKVTEVWWNLPGLYVHYQPIWADTSGRGTDIREGLIRIETETARKARSAAPKTPKPKM